MSTVQVQEFAPLRDRVRGDVVAPGDPAWDEARLAWNLSVDQHPAAVVIAETADDVAETVRFAVTYGYAVSAQGTGHGASALERGLEGVILIKTQRMRDVEINPDRRIARVGAGALWMDVTAPAHEHGLAPLAGSSPDVGVVGYTLGGGLSWLGRTYGMASNSVTAIEVVTADGEIVRTDASHEPALFWALRGGGGSFGIVTAIEFSLYPVSEVYAGVMFWPIERSAEVLRAWHELAPSMPDAMTTVGRLLMLPPIPDIPEFLRGRKFVVVEAIYVGSEQRGAELLAPLRALEPEMDTVSTISTVQLGTMHMDPEHPVPGAGDGMLLDDITPQAIQELAAKATAGELDALLSIELRQLGGAIARPVPGQGAVGHFDAAYAMFSVGIAPTPQAKLAVGGAVGSVIGTFDEHRASSSYINFHERGTPTSELYPRAVYQRLTELKRWYDPADVIRSNHPIPPAE
jgi:hypothetical protein